MSVDAFYFLITCFGSNVNYKNITETCGIWCAIEVYKAGKIMGSLCFCSRTF